MSSYYPGFQWRVLCLRQPVENKPKHFTGSSTSASKRLLFLSVCVLLLQAHCSFYNHLSDSLRGQQGAGGGEEGCSVPQITIPLLLLPLSCCLGPWQQDIALLWLHQSQCTPCWLIVTRWTLTAQPALTMCSLDRAACDARLPPPSPLQPTALSVCCW